MSNHDDPVKRLVIERVHLKDFAVLTSDELDVEFLPEDLYTNGQRYSTLSSIETFTEDGEDDGEPKYYVRYLVALGNRFISTEQRHNNTEESDLSPYVEFKAKFWVEYVSSVELDIESLEAFSETHLNYHLWPYWREFIQSSCARIQLPAVVVPPYRVKVKKSE
jgi:hypothetical protein